MWCEWEDRDDVRRGRWVDCGDVRRKRWVDRGDARRGGGRIVVM